MSLSALSVIWNIPLLQWHFGNDSSLIAVLLPSHWAPLDAPTWSHGLLHKQKGCDYWNWSKYKNSKTEFGGRLNCFWPDLIVPAVEIIRSYCRSFLFAVCGDAVHEVCASGTWLSSASLTENKLFSSRLMFGWMLHCWKELCTYVHFDMGLK